MAILAVMDGSKTVPALDIPAIREDALRRLGEQLFAEVRRQSAQDDADIAGWKQARSQWPEILGSQLAKFCSAATTAPSRLATAAATSLATAIEPRVASAILKIRLAATRVRV